MVSADEFEKELQEISKQHRKEHQDALVRLKLKQGKIEKDFLEYVASDIIDSYNKLMEQRSVCIDKFTKFFALFEDAKEDVGIDELYKHLFHTKEVEFDIWKAEMKYFVELKKSSENYSEKEYEKEIRACFNGIDNDSK